jgi:hypothetical protein
MKIVGKRFCGMFLTLAALCVFSGCATANYYRLKQTRNDIDASMTRYHNEVSFAAISPEFQTQVNTAYHAYQKAFDAAVEQAHSNTDAPTPDNVKQLADRLLLILGSIPAAP